MKMNYDQLYCNSELGHLFECYQSCEAIYKKNNIFKIT